MPTTSGLALPYPALTAAPNVPADIQALADRIEALWGGAWTAYTPALTSSGTAPNLGTGPVASGRYKQIGKTVFFQFTLRFGTSPTIGTGFYSVSLPPVTAAATWDTGGANGRDIGSGSVSDDSAGTNAAATVRFAGVGTVFLVATTTGVVGAATPFAFTTADFLRGQGCYEAA